MTDEWQSLAEEKILAALEQGKFDNLPGAGKPFEWDDENPFADESMSSAYDLLKANGFSLPWLEDRRSIEAEVAYQQQILERAWLNFQRMALEESWWQARVAQFKAEIAALNKRILTLNLRVPDAAFQMRPVDAQTLIDEITLDS